MKTLATALALLAVAAALPVRAQVQIYGSLDGGLDSLSNVGGSRDNAVNTGRRSPDRIGFRGSEDLGGGLAAFFRLESGFNTDTGASTRPTTFFNRYSQLGLRSNTFGTLTLGHMPDFMYEYAAPHSNAVPGVSAAFNPGNLDNLANQFQIDNAVKLESPEWNGFQLGAMKGVKEAGAEGSHSVGVQYRSTALRVAGAASSFRGRTADVRTLFGLTSLLGQVLPPGTMFNAPRFRTQGLGASYAIGNFTPHVLVTRVRLGNANGEETLRNVHAGLIVDVSGGQKINLVHLSFARSTFADRQFDQVNLFASHMLSKSTQVYASLNHAKAPDGASAGLFGYGRSSTDTQTLVRVGMQTQF